MVTRYCYRDMVTRYCYRDMVTRYCYRDTVTRYCLYYILSYWTGKNSIVDCVMFTSLYADMGV